MDISSSILNHQDNTAVTRDSSTPNDKTLKTNKSFFLSPLIPGAKAKTGKSDMEASIRRQEQYLNDFKSIDLSKYTFANEFKPKTDYTYARTGMYLTSKVNEDEGIEMPNLCRRSRLTPENSYLSNLSTSIVNKTRSSTLGLFKLIKTRIFTRSVVVANTSKLNHSQDEASPPATSNERSFVLNHFYGLDRNQRLSQNDSTTKTTHRFYKSFFSQQSDSNDTSRRSPLTANNVSEQTNRSKKSMIKSFFKYVFLVWLMLLALMSILNSLYILPLEVANFKYDVIRYLNLNGYSDLYSQLPSNQQEITSNIQFENACTDQIRQLREEMRNTIKMLQEKALASSTFSENNVAISETSQMEKINFTLEIDRATLKLKEDFANLLKHSLHVYNADKTGKTDFASESLGASIMFTRCTETYTEKSRWFTVMNIQLMPWVNTPRVIIQNEIHPGNCYAFKGDKADIFIKLAATIHATSFSIEHIPKELTPSNNLDTAPQNFSVYGFANEEQIDLNEGFLLGNFEFDNTSPDFIQFFDVQNHTDVPLKIVELKINSNGGSKDYTCIYKFRVHGTMLDNANQ